jgi:hypothetical protein
MKQINFYLHKGIIHATLAPITQSVGGKSQKKSSNNNKTMNDNDQVPQPNLGAAAFVFLAAIVVLLTLGTLLVKFIF